MCSCRGSTAWPCPRAIRNKTSVFSFLVAHGTRCVCIVMQRSSGRVGASPSFWLGQCLLDYSPIVNPEKRGFGAALLAAVSVVKSPEPAAISS